MLGRRPLMLSQSKHGVGFFSDRRVCPSVCDGLARPGGASPHSDRLP
jgi:hypothetical protein